MVKRGEGGGGHNFGGVLHVSRGRWRHGALRFTYLDGGLEAASGGKEGARAGHDDSGLVGRPHVEPEHLAHPPATSTRLSWALLG